MSQTAEQETANTSAPSERSQSYTCIQAAVESLSGAQLDLYLHEIEWILSQLEETPYATREDNKKPHQQEMYEQFIHVEEQVFAIKDALVLERARRSIIHLQGLILGRGKSGE
jgi:hypothetical protein